MTNPYSQMFNTTNPQSIKIAGNYMPSAITAISQGTPEPDIDDIQTEFFPPTPLSKNNMNKVQLISIQHGGHDLSSFRSHGFSYAPQTTKHQPDTGAFLEDYRQTKHFKNGINPNNTTSLVSSLVEHQSMPHEEQHQACECERLPELLTQLERLK